MPTAPHSFKRLVLGLQPSASDRSLRLAVELAKLLDLDLLGLFLEDVGLRDFAGFPFARELRLLGGGWQPIDVERLSQEMELAARSAERSFAEAVKQVSIHCQFEVKRGTIATTIATVSQASDIVMIVEPASAGERATAQFSRLLQAAFRSAAAVMIAPTRIARARGPIVAIARAWNDPSVAVASTIARAAEETLFVLDIGEGSIDDERVRSLAAATGLRIKHVVAGKAARADPTTLVEALRLFQERLVIMTRGATDERFVPILAAERHVPVLVVEPPPLPKVDVAPPAGVSS
jgi:hypothetical protein